MGGCMGQYTIRILYLLVAATMQLLAQTLLCLSLHLTLVPAAPWPRRKGHNVLHSPPVPGQGEEWRSLKNPEELGEYFEGDIQFPLPPHTKNGLIDEKYRWQGGIVPFEFGTGFELAQTAVVLQAMQDYADLTDGCITFVSRTDQEDYIHFTQNENHGCSSAVGKRGGQQTINYPQWCLDKYGSVLHEMYHALGFYHEQSRYDRDDYITVMWENIEPGKEHNFNKYSSDVVSGFGEAYDYGSVMHYSAYAFSVNGEKTIVTHDPNAEIGQRESLSSVDLSKLLNMYKC